MNQRKYILRSVALAAALGLTSCAAGGQGGTAGDNASGSATPAAATPSASQPGSAPATTTAAPASTAPAPATTASVPVPATTVTVPAPATPAMPTATSSQAPATAAKSFTFPDGHLTFSYPGDWTVRLARSGPPSNPGGADPVQAILADGTGNELLGVTSGADAVDASGPVLRTVLDTAPVPGLKDTDGEQLAFGFAFDSFADHPEFHMGVRRDRDFLPSPADSGSPQVQLPNGAAEASVIFGMPAFASIDDAKAWMSTTQYSQLKEVLLSLNYS